MTVLHFCILLKEEKNAQSVKYCQNLRKNIIVGIYPYKYLIKDFSSLTGVEKTVQPQKPKQNLNQGQDNLFKIPFPNPNKLQLIYR